LSVIGASALWQRLVWFVGLWLAGVASVAALGYIIRLWLV